jgi:hypothetical protein
MCKHLDPISRPTNKTNNKEQKTISRSALPCPTRNVKGNPHRKKMIPDETMNLHKGVKGTSKWSHTSEYSPII